MRSASSSKTSFNSLSAFWEAIRTSGIVSVRLRKIVGPWPTTTTTTRKHGKANCRYMGALDNADCFDPTFFHISLLEARHLDLQQRLFLEEA
ncbi:beta-ketoacyl synthase N-terminal-like domain-containing protein [Rhizobium rhizogenes]